MEIRMKQILAHTKKLEIPGIFRGISITELNKIYFLYLVGAFGLFE